MRVARLSIRSAVKPRIALERDGALYDVEALEAALGAAVPIAGDAWDFHGRAVALGFAGLAELDQKLLQGRRPSSARIDATAVDSGFAWLPPFDAERAQLLEVDVRGEPSLRLMHAPSALGQDALVDVRSNATRAALRVFVAVLVGEDLRDASLAEAKHALAGCMVGLDWGEGERRGLRPQLGPVVVPLAALGSLRSLRVRVQRAGQLLDFGTLGEQGLSLESALAFASSIVPVRAGDVVAVGPLGPAGTPKAHALELALHEQVAVSLDRVGELRGAAVPTRT